MRKSTTISVTQAKKLAQKIAGTIKGGEVFALIGPLGAGKTTFVKHLALMLSYKKAVTSPTFTLLQTYQGKNPKSGTTLYIHHLDLYRTADIAEVISSGLTEQWGSPDSITLIEWADKIPELLPKNTTPIFFTPLL